MKKHLWGITALLLSAVMFIFGAAVQSREESGTAGIAYAQGNTGEQDAESPFKQVYRQVSPSVVGIEVSSPSVIFGGRINCRSPESIFRRLSRRRTRSSPWLVVKP